MWTFAKVTQIKISITREISWLKSSATSASTSDEDYLVTNFNNKQGKQ